MLPLVCIDVDGTLVGESGNPTEGIWSAVKDAQGRGQHLAICTGRPGYGKTFEFARRLDPNGWHVFQNGASILNVTTKTAMSSPLSQDIVDYMTDLSLKNGWVLEYYSDFDHVADTEDQRAKDHCSLLGVPFQRRTLAELQGEIVRVQFIVPIEIKEQVMSLMPETVSLSPAGSPVMKDSLFISVTAAGVSKASAVLRIAEKLGVSSQNVMMVGDGHNDADAMRAVGHGVAMGNADKEAKEAARYHVGHVEDDGLAEALELSARLTSV